MQHQFERDSEPHLVMMTAMHDKIQQSTKITVNTKVVMAVGGCDDGKVIMVVVVVVAL